MACEASSSLLQPADVRVVLVTDDRGLIVQLVVRVRRRVPVRREEAQELTGLEPLDGRSETANVTLPDGTIVVVHGPNPLHGSMKSILRLAWRQSPRSAPERPESWTLLRRRGDAGSPVRRSMPIPGPDPTCEAGTAHRRPQVNSAAIRNDFHHGSEAEQLDEHQRHSRGSGVPSSHCTDSVHQRRRRGDRPASFPCTKRTPVRGDTRKARIGTATTSRGINFGSQRFIQRLKTRTGLRRAAGRGNTPGSASRHPATAPNAAASIARIPRRR